MKIFFSKINLLSESIENFLSNAVLHITCLKKYLVVICHLFTEEKLRSAWEKYSIYMSNLFQIGYGSINY